MDAGGQPITVICNSKQKKPTTGLRSIKKVSPGSNSAMSNRINIYSIIYYM